VLLASFCLSRILGFVVAIVSAIVAARRRLDRQTVSNPNPSPASCHVTDALPHVGGYTAGVLLFYHGLRGSGSPVLIATGFVNGKGQFLTPYRIDIPQPIIKTFVTGDYVSDPYGWAKLGAHPSTWASGRMGEI